MRRRGGQQHNIEGAFVLVLFAVFAITVIAVLALGANSYQRLVGRDNDAYNRRIITSYVAARIRSGDAVASIAVGGFNKADVDDGVNTLHIFQEVEGDRYDQRIYFYEGEIYEIEALEDVSLEPADGTPILEAKDLRFEMEDGVITVFSTDMDNRENRITLSVRSLLNGVKGSEQQEDSGGVG